VAKDRTIRSRSHIGSRIALEVHPGSPSVGGSSKRDGTSKKKDSCSAWRPSGRCVDRRYGTRPAERTLLGQGMPSSSAGGPAILRRVRRPMPKSLGFRLQFGLRIKRRAGAPGYLSTATLLVASGFHLGIRGSVEDVSVGVLPEIVSALLGYSPKVSRCVPPFGSASTL
jgi:hypothetical protein